MDMPLFTSEEQKNFFKTENIVGARLKKRQLYPFFNNPEIVKILNNDSFLESLDRYFSCGFNISEATKQSYLHRNTLIYRIEKIKRIFGLDIKNFDDATIFRNLRHVYKKIYIDQVK